MECASHTRADSNRLWLIIMSANLPVLQVILTQPPLDWGAFERWWSDAEKRGLPRAAKLLIGFPALSSAANASFWLALAGGGGSSAARGVVVRFAEAESRGRQAAAEFAREFSEEQLRQVGGGGGRWLNMVLGGG